MLPNGCVFSAVVRSLLGLGIWLCMSSLPRAMARQAPEEDEDFFEMSLEDLANEPYKVVSASRQSQKIGEVSVPVSVITHEDIHDSGLTSLPEVLRFYPGVDVLTLDRNCSAVGVSFPLSGKDSDEPVHNREYKIKAAFLYNFLRTVDWPEGRFADGNEPWVIGIVGKDPFGDIFDQVGGKGVKDRQVIIRRFPSVQDTPTADPQKERRVVQTDEWRKCHLLFVCRSEQASASGILQTVAGFSVLTVGEVQGFLESGGCINFIPTADKGDFEINLGACKQAHLKVSSKLIRIAQRVMQGKK